MARDKRIDIISCPFCGAEYTAGEIYLPKAFLGYPEDIDRECTTHKIISDLGKPMNIRESYICDFCNTPFKVYATVRFNTVEDETNNFNKNYRTPLKKNVLFMEED